MPCPEAFGRPAAAAPACFFPNAAEFLLRKAIGLLASPFDAAGGDSGGYENLRLIAGGDVGEDGVWIRSDGEDSCGGAAAAVLLSLPMLLLLRLGAGEEGVSLRSVRSVPVRSSSAFRVGAIGCGERRGTKVSGKNEKCVRCPLAMTGFSVWGERDAITSSTSKRSVVTGNISAVVVETAENVAENVAFHARIGA